MLVDSARSSGRHHASDWWGTYASTAPRCQNHDRLGPPCSDRKQRLPANWTTVFCANRRILGCPRHRSLGVPLQRFRRSYLYGTHLRLAPAGLDALPKGQVMRWQASKKACKPCCILSTKLAWPCGAQAFSGWGATPAHFSEHNVTNLAFGGARSWEALLRQRNSFSPAATILYYCGSNDVNAGKTRPCRAFASSLNTRDRLPDTDIFFARSIGHRRRNASRRG